MATLYTYGEFIMLSPSQFNSYSAIRYSPDEPAEPVYLGFTASGSVNFSSKLGTVSAEIDGWTGNDNITSGSGNDSLWGNGGNDTLYGGIGADLLFGDWVTDDLVGYDYLYGGTGNDGLVGGAGNDSLYGGDGDDGFLISESLPGADQYFGGAGVDSVYIGDVFGIGLSEVRFSRLVLNSAASVEYFGTEYSWIVLKGTDGSDLIDLSGTIAMTGYDEQISFKLGLGNDSFTGGTSAENIVVSDGGDNVSLGEGDDWLSILDGAIGNSTVNGGAGYDTLVLGDITYSPSTLVHQVAVSSLSFITTSSFENVQIWDEVQLTGTDSAENFSLLGSTTQLYVANTILMLGGNDRFTAGANSVKVDGGSGGDTLIGGLGDDVLLGGLGIDSLVGGQGNDEYQVDDVGDIVVELADQGYDRIITSLAEYSLGAAIENVKATGAVGLSATGNDLYNQMTGAEGRDHFRGLGGSDTLDGGAGIDTLEGGAGADFYYVTTGDVVIETADVSVDTVYAVGQVFVLPEFVEILRSSSTTTGLDGAGNAEDNGIYGGSLNDTLRGQFGNDTIYGAAGSDGLNGDQGKDSLDGGLGNDSLLGGGGDDTLVGSDGDDVLEGQEGADRLIGGNGNDRYMIGDALDRIVESSAGGIDTVVSTIATYELAAELENLEADASLIGVHFSGNRANNSIWDSAGNDSLEGGDGDDRLYSNAGLDTLVGGGGNNTYYIGAEAGLTRIIESNAYDLQDRIYTYASVTVLTNFVDELYILSETGATARAESKAPSELYGGIGDDLLQYGSYMDGGAGADTMVGATAGGSVFVVDNAGDEVRAVASGAAERVNLHLQSYTMGGRLENLTVFSTLGAAVTGNGLNNLILGNNGADTLIGLDGDDTLSGGVGADLLQGGNGNDVLDYSMPRDTLDGGAGDDTYTAVSGKVRILEARDGGHDTIELLGAITSFTLPGNVEDLSIYTGYLVTVEATGNKADNFIKSYNGALVAWGLAGDDTMEAYFGDSVLHGGLGNDVYILGDGALTVVELAGEGIDKVLSPVSVYLLADNVEDLELLGVAEVRATGNALANHITGNNVANVLIGGLGADTLSGGAGGDGFVFTDLTSADVVTDFDRIDGDKIQIDRAVFTGMAGASPGEALRETQFKDLSLGAQDNSDRILYDPTTGELFFDVDALGGAAPVLFAVLDGGPTLTYLDIRWW